MITFNCETFFILKDENKISNWIEDIISNHNFEVGDINYIFCDDEYLHKMNVKFLQHDTLTDIISFDNSLGKLIAGDIFISVDRVKENSLKFKASFEQELHRVMIHGILHFFGFKDKTEKEKKNMRERENEALSKITI